MIRKAKPEDAEQVVPLMLQAMGELAMKFAGSDHPQTINKLFQHFFKLPGNQYSFENTLVYIKGKTVLGSINAYDGAKLDMLRKPFLNYPKGNGTSILNNSEPETATGEFYIDTVSVKPETQGKGIGKQLIKAGINLGKTLGHHSIGLLVEQDNDRAFKLYQNMGFVTQNEKQFMGGMYHHMVFNIKQLLV